jgi:hypothetical protein
VEHVKSQGHKDKAKEVILVASEDVSPERYKAYTKATPQVEVYPSLPHSRAWDSQLPRADLSPLSTPRAAKDA